MFIVGTILFVVLPCVLAAWVAYQFYLEHRSDRVPILLYHRLVSRAGADQSGRQDDERIWASYDTSFVGQMNYLKEAGYTTLDFDDYLAVRDGRMPMPARPIIVTFDDGYSSNYELGYPVLKANGQKAVIYVALDPDEHTRNLVAGVDGWLSDAQMKELATNGVAIQSHTLTHCILNELPTEQARHELVESKRRLAEVTGRAVEHIAIPRAGYSRRIYRLVVEAGYKTACCNKKGTATGLSDPLALPRIVVERDMTVAEFASYLQPRAAFMLRLVGNLKRIPELIGGATFASRVRKMLYRGPLKPLFKARNLKRAVPLVGAVYLVGCVWFIWSHFVRG